MGILVELFLIEEWSIGKIESVFIDVGLVQGLLLKQWRMLFEGVFAKLIEAVAIGVKAVVVESDGCVHVKPAHK
jgi:hypothetical protein